MIDEAGPFSSTVSLLIFCLLALSIIDRRMLKYSTMIVGLLISPHSSISFCLMYSDVVNEPPRALSDPIFYASVQHMLPDPSESSHHSLRQTCPGRPFLSLYTNYNAWVARRSRQRAGCRPQLSPNNLSIPFA